MNKPKVVLESAEELALSKILNGLLTHLPVTTAVVLNGKSFTQAELVKAVESLRKPLADERVAKDAYLVAKSTREAQVRDVAVMIREVRYAIRGLFGENSPVVESFGFKKLDGRHRQLTAEEKVARAEKAARTRELRHTLGPRQKAALKAGSVPPISLPRPGPDAAGPTKIPA